MQEAKAGGYVSELCFNNGCSVALNANDIVIFVGPNNAGKSQSLKDIFSLTEHKCSTIVISDVKIKKFSKSVSALMDEIAVVFDRGTHKEAYVLGMNWHIYPHSDASFLQSEYYSNFRNLFVMNLDTTARLSICNATNNIARNAVKRHPIHYAAFDSKYRKWLSDNFKKAFGIGLMPNTHFGGVVPLCLGNPVVLDGNFEDEQERQEAYAKAIENYEQVHQQGDGIKSFTGILLYLMMKHYCLYLIDEPESFLHPPQARIMGQVIGESLSETQQAFISTHSEEIIKGLMDVCPERLKIIRINREGKTNSFSVLSNVDFRNVWDDPLLKHSNIMSSIFHKTVVLCESDADCKMYSIIERYLKQSEGRYSETFFVHCSGKHRMGRIATALRSLDIDVRLIPDIDVMNDENVFKGIVEAFGIEWNSVAKEYKIIVSNLHSNKEKINRNEAKSAINSILNSSAAQDLSNGELKAIRRIISTVSKWEALKESGFAAIPRGDATCAFQRLNGVLINAGIHIVPVGELECFVKSVGGHGPEWVDKVLETYPDLNDNVYDGLKSFIGGINL